MTVSAGFDWNAEVNLTVQAVAGIKLKVLGYEIAEWDKTFMNRIEQVIMMEMALYGGTHDEYLTKIYEGFCDALNGEMRNKIFVCVTVTMSVSDGVEIAEEGHLAAHGLTGRELTVDPEVTLVEV